MNKYHYCYGDGGTAGVKEVTLGKFATMNKASSMIQNLLEYTQDIGGGYEKEILYFEDQLIENIQGIWRDSIKGENKPAALKIMFGAWGYERMAKILR